MPVGWAAAWVTSDHAKRLSCLCAEPPELGSARQNRARVTWRSDAYGPSDSAEYFAPGPLIHRNSRKPITLFRANTPLRLSEEA